MHPLLFIINGEKVPITASPEETLAEARNVALEVSKNTGRTTEDWEVRKDSGELLDVCQTVRELALERHERLFVTLRMGVGGS